MLKIKPLICGVAGGLVAWGFYHPDNSMMYLAGSILFFTTISFTVTMRHKKAG